MANKKPVRIIEVGIAGLRNTFWALYLKYERLADSDTSSKYLSLFHDCQEALGQEKYLP